MADQWKQDATPDNTHVGVSLEHVCVKAKNEYSSQYEDGTYFNARPRTESVEMVSVQSKLLFSSLNIWEMSSLLY